MVERIGTDLEHLAALYISGWKDAMRTIDRAIAEAIDRGDPLPPPDATRVVRELDQRYAQGEEHAAHIKAPHVAEAWHKAHEAYAKLRTRVSDGRILADDAFEDLVRSAKRFSVEFRSHLRDAYGRDELRSTKLNGSERTLYDLI